MTESTWMTLEEAGMYLGISHERLWDYIMGRIKGKRLTVYRLAGGDELRLRFFLPGGAYATMVLRELLQFS